MEIQKIFVFLHFLLTEKKNLNATTIHCNRRNSNKIYHIMEDLNEMQKAQQPVEETATIQPLAEQSAENTPAAQTPDPEAPVSEAIEVAETPKDENFVEPEVDYTGRSREEMIDAMKELLQEDITHIRNRVNALRAAFYANTRELQKAAFDKFVEEGGNKDEYQPADDPVANSFRKLYNEFRDRRQKHIDAIEAKKKANLLQKRTLLDELKQIIENETDIKKAYDEFNSVQDRWKAIGDVPRDEANNLWQNYHFLIEQFFNKVRINKELRLLDMKKNLEQKMALCEKAEELIVEPSVVKAFKGLQDLRAQWKEVGPVPTEHNEDIWTRFCKAADQISTRHREHFEQLHSEQEKNLLAKQALLEKATELSAANPVSAKEWNATSDALDELLKIWKTIGPVPREQSDEIWKNFKSTIDEFYTRKHTFYAERKGKEEENYNKKVDLCLKAEAIAKREDWKKATAELLQLQDEWKNIGFVNQKVSDQIWRRFRAACDEFFAKKAEYFNNIHESEADNLAKKEALVAQIKAFQGGDNKDENLKALKEFQRQWMEVGYVPQSEKDRLKKEYREAIDAQFEKLKISAREAEENAYREHIRNAAGDARRFVTNEREDILDKIEKFRSDIQLWENNLGFLANSKQADLLKSEFEKKMQGARQQIALLQAKLRILNESDTAEKKEAAAPAENNEPAAE